jgi:regulator of sigma E protease
MGFVYLLHLLALISINLGVINIVPFPALDGGRALFIILEKIKGSPLPVKAEQMVNGIGFVFLIALMALITIRDVGRLF